MLNQSYVGREGAVRNDRLLLGLGPIAVNNVLHGASHQPYLDAAQQDR